jgi:amidase
MEAPAKTLEDYFRLNHQRNIAISDFNKLWLANDLDVILTVPAPHTAVPFDQWNVTTYTALYNLLDCPACVIPVGKVSGQDLKGNLFKYGEIDKITYDLCE